jgi:hypothetical protein
VNFKQFLTEEYKLRSYPDSGFLASSPKVLGNCGYLPSNINEDLIEAYSGGDLGMFGETPVPADQLIEVMMLVDGEFEVLVPTPNVVYNDQQIGRALMQVVEASGDAEEFYIGNKEFPQQLKWFVLMAQWLVETNQLSRKSKSIKQGGDLGFIFGSVKSVLNSFVDIKKLG